jgi:hypothetical protein
MGVEPLRIIAEGEMTVVDARVHVGGVALADLLDHLPAKYIGPAKATYGQARVTVDLRPALGAEEVAA